MSVSYANFPALKNPSDLLGEDVIKEETNKNIEKILSQFKIETNYPFKKTCKVFVRVLDFRRKIVQIRTEEALKKAGWDVKIIDEKEREPLPAKKYHSENSWIISVADKKLE